MLSEVWHRRCSFPCDSYLRRGLFVHFGLSQGYLKFSVPRLDHFMQEGSSHTGRRDNSQSRAGSSHDETTLAASRILKSLSGPAGAPMRPTSSGIDAGATWAATSHALPANARTYQQTAHQTYHSSVDSNHIRQIASHVPARPQSQMDRGGGHSSPRPNVPPYGIPQHNQRLPIPSYSTSSARHPPPPSGPPASGQPYGAMNFQTGHYGPTGSPYPASQQPAMYPASQNQFNPYAFGVAQPLPVNSFYSAYSQGPVGPTHRNIEP